MTLAVQGIRALDFPISLCLAVCAPVHSRPDREAAGGLGLGLRGHVFALGDVSSRFHGWPSLSPSPLDFLAANSARIRDRTEGAEPLTTAVSSPSGSKSRAASAGETFSSWCAEAALVWRLLPVLASEAAASDIVSHACPGWRTPREQVVG